MYEREGIVPYLNAPIILLLLAAVICGTASAAELHVGPGQTYSTIQSAYDAASNGDVIILYAGDYTENVDVNKRLTLLGEGADVVTAVVAMTLLYTSQIGHHVFGLNFSSFNIFTTSTVCPITKNPWR